MAKKFEHETFYDDLRAMLETDSTDPEVVLSPYIEEFDKRAEQVRQEARMEAAFSMLFQDELGKQVTIKDWDWIKFFPYLLDKHRVNHAEAAAYMMYRLYSTGNVIYSVSKHLVEAFFRTDFQIDFNKIHFPHQTFIVYWGGGDHSLKINNGKHSILAQFVDVVPLTEKLVQLRQVYLYKDDDNDLANSGITTLSFSPEDFLLDSNEFFKQVASVDYSSLNDMPVSEEHRYNNYVMYQLLFNFLLYVNNVGDQRIVSPDERFKRLNGVSNPKKRRRIQKELASQSPYRYTYIGGAYDRRVESVSQRGGGHQLSHEVVVRGHWRQQWIGPRKDSAGKRIPGTHQKLIWIEPFIKGKGKGEPEKTLVYRVV